MFCIPCNAFIERWKLFVAESSNLAGCLIWEDYSEPLHDGLDALQQSAGKSCRICLCIWLALDREEKECLPVSTRVILQVQPNVGEGRPVLLAVFMDGQEKATIDSNPRLIALYLRENMSPSISQTLQEIAAMDNSTTGSEASFKLARLMLSDCISHHDSCRKVSPSFLPTRVIDVGPSDGSTEPRLQETQELGDGDRNQHYIALSHCWGKEQFLTTKTTNLAAHKKLLPMNSLPLSFQHTIIATRKMDVRYLWIDSLCILQDSLEDWTVESAQMCKVYENALFTIISAHSQNAYGGLFVKRDGAQVLPYEIIFEYQEGHHSILFLPASDGSARDETWELPTYGRGWCLQELILSNRAIIFERAGILWECTTTAWSERFQTTGRHHNWTRDVQKYISFGSMEKGAFEDRSEDQQLALRWGSLIEEYTSRQLTRYSDKLVAVAGVADAFQKQSGDEYLAGLWKSHLYMHILWFVRHVVSDSIPVLGNMVMDNNNGDSSSVGHPPPYRMPDSIAPTWSWASLNVPVNYHSFQVDYPMCEFLQSHAIGSPQVQTGSITIRSDIREFRILNYTPSLRAETKRVARLPSYQSKNPFGRGLYDNPPFEWVRPMLSPASPFQLLKKYQVVAAEWFPDEIINEEAPVTFAAIARQEYADRSADGAEKDQIVYTLALVPTGRVPGEYRRVGFAMWKFCSWFGYDCDPHRALKGEASRKLSRSWEKFNPPVLCRDLHAHPIRCGPLPDESAYHALARVKRSTLSIV